MAAPRPRRRGTARSGTVSSVDPESITITWSAHAIEPRQRAMFASSSRVSTTTVTGTLPGGGSSPAGTAAARAWSLETPQHPVEVRVRIERVRVRHDAHAQRRLGRVPQGVPVTQVVAAQRGARRSPGFAVCSWRSPATPRRAPPPAGTRTTPSRSESRPLRQRAHSRRICSTLSRPTRCSRGLRASEAGTSVALAVTISRTESSIASSTALTHSAMRSAIRLYGAKSTGHRISDPPWRARRPPGRIPGAYARQPGRRRPGARPRSAPPSLCMARRARRICGPPGGRSMLAVSRRAHRGVAARLLSDSERKCRALGAGSTARRPAL